MQNGLNIDLSGRASTGTYMPLSWLAAPLARPSDVAKPSWRSRSSILALLLIVILFSPIRGYSQPAGGAATQDPLMGLMLTQPRIDVESPVIPVAEFEPSTVKVGQEAVYRVTFNALETSIEPLAKLSTIPAAEWRAGGHGQLLVLTGTNYQPRTTFIFRVRPSQPGQLTVPAFKLTVYGKVVTVPAAQLQVVPDPPPAIPPAQVLRLELPRTNVYVGQAVHAYVTLPPSTSLVLQHSSPLQINGQGFILDPSTLRPARETRRLGDSGASLPSLVYDVVLTPISSGKLKVFAQAFVGSRGSPNIIITAAGPVPGLPQYTLVDSDSVEVQVLPLPREGQLPGFTGAVGSFAADAVQLATNVLHVGEPVKLTVRIRGEGNLLRVVPPPPPRVEQWRVFAGEANATHPQIIQAQGFTVFHYLVVPLTEHVQKTPEIPFSCFDPVEGKYLDSTIPSVPVTVLPGAAPADLAILEQADAVAEKPEKEPVLSGLAASPGLAAASLVPLQRQAWFPFLQLAPAAAFVGLWTWDRRRRYLEAHPEVVLRRRARRLLRRQWRMVRKAAARQDGLEFASAAVRALDIASSPFYPADPRAVVGADVLALLSETERSSPRGLAVRELFDANDASRFSSEHPDPVRLLRLQPEVDALLKTLDQRLRL